jgi:DNA-binding transcriptional ArsR family regulator
MPTATKRRKIFFSGTGDPIANSAEIVHVLRNAPSGMSLSDLSSHIRAIRNDDLRRYVVRLLSNGDVQLKTDESGLPRYTAQK